MYMYMYAISKIDVIGAGDERDVCHRQATYRRTFNILLVLLSNERTKVNITISIMMQNTDIVIVYISKAVVMYEVR